jgi:ElaB/YqjD/DUF883 family membrane-anchored ribosome-binding protein
MKTKRLELRILSASINDMEENDGLYLPTVKELRRIRQLDRGRQTDHFLYHLLLPKILGFWSFVEPKHKGIELADVLVWWEDVVLLFEAKTKETEANAKESWIRDRIKDAIKSINSRVDMLKSGEVGVLKNRWVGEVPWDPSGVTSYIGIVVIHHNSEPYDPGDIAPDDFKASKVPIAVISLADLMVVVRHMNTVWDLIIYFECRFRLVLRQKLPVHQEEELFQAVLSWYPELTEGHLDWEDAIRYQQYQLSISNAIIRSEIATEQGYSDLAASYLIDVCIRAMAEESTRDDKATERYSRYVRAMAALSEMARYRRTEYGKRMLELARDAAGTSGTAEKASYSPSRDRVYLFVAFGGASSIPEEPYLEMRAKQELNKADASSFLGIGAQAEKVTSTYEWLLGVLKGQDPPFIPSNYMQPTISFAERIPLHRK